MIDTTATWTFDSVDLKHSYGLPQNIFGYGTFPWMDRERSGPETYVAHQYRIMLSHEYTLVLS